MLLQITDSAGHTLYAKEDATKGKFAFTTEDYDMFEACFESKLPVGECKKVQLDAPGLPSLLSLLFSLSNIWLWAEGVCFCQVLWHLLNCKTAFNPRRFIS